MKTILCIAIILALASSYYIEQAKCCTPTEYYDATQKKCMPCSDKCNGCAESNEAHDNGEDTGCICKGTLCKPGKCDKTGCLTCVDAKAGQKIFKAAGVCFECTDKANCEECTAGADDCNKCKKGYALVNKKCEKCSDNCLVCNSSAACTVCADNYMLSAAICVKCIDNCDVCTKATEQCSTCSDGYGFWNKVCNQCSGSKAKTCAETTTKHTACKTSTTTGHYLNDSNTCTDCIANCTECTKDTATKCAAGKCASTFQRATETSCAACTATKAMTRRELQAGNSACKDCKDAEPTKCTSCLTDPETDERYFSFKSADNSCHPNCAVLNGPATNDGMQTCKTCVRMAPLYAGGTAADAGYVEANSYNIVLVSGHCVVCALGCKTCTTNAAAKCTELLPGFKKDADTTEFTATACVTGGTLARLSGCIGCNSVVAHDAGAYNACQLCGIGTQTPAAGTADKVCVACNSTLKTFSYCGAHCATPQAGHASATCLTSCKVGSFPNNATFDNNGQKCIACHTTCTTCENKGAAGEGKCTDCPAGKGNDSDATNASCADCVPTNCTLCQADKKTCTQCAEGYHTPGTSNCTACTTAYQCKTCSKANECDSCATARILNATTKMCEDCATGCKPGQCTSKGACNAGSCAATYMETTAITCTKCIDNCKVCTEANKCATCATGWLKVGDTCSQCDKNCSACSAANKCDSGKCNDGYRLATDVCEKCDDASCKLCGGSKDTCTECLATSKKGIKSGKCEDCPTNCKSCVSDATQCATCEDGYYGNGTTKCTQCPAGCNKCTSATACGAANCKPGYYGEQCIKCAADCDKCAEKDKCNADGCKTGFVYIESSKTCASKVTCESNQYYDTAKNTCNACGTDCLTCKSNTECTRCKEGFYPETGKHSCKACTTSHANMDNCDSTGAVATCKSGYGKIGTACEACITNCESCTAKTTCAKCMPGYNFTLDAKTCGECAEGCSHCYSNCARGCSKCFDKNKSPPSCGCDTGSTWNKVTKMCDKAAAKTTAATTTPATTPSASANILKFAAIVLISLISLL